MTEEKEERIWWCRNCGCEFDIEDSAIKIIQEPTHGNCLIVIDGRAHSLTYTTWEAVKRKKFAEDHAFDKIQPVEKSEPEVKEATESMDDFIGNLLGSKA